MRILAIRGKNLASLAGAFAVDFQTQPLANTGLFAICGPTGAGKSTLLDALCLALYDATPRLKNPAVNKRDPQLPDSAENTLSQQDPRNLLRRGAVDGFAEVDFVGNDGVAYRARWSVRRARNKAQGKLQDAELTLQTVDGLQRIGGVKTEVKEALYQRIGLSFEQFTRAVLLAQNEFAAFLKADQNQRATLLETLTGANIYRLISQCAHLRNKSAGEQLQLLQQQLSGAAPLDTALRQQWQHTLNEAQGQIAALEQRRTSLEQQWQWQQHWQVLQRAAQQAEQIWQQALAQQQLSAERQQRLAQVEAVQEARLLVDGAERSTAACAASQAKVQSATTAQQQAQQRLQQAESARLQALNALAHAEQQRTAAAGELQQARQLDATLQALLPHHAQSAQDLHAAQQALAAAQQQCAAKQGTLQQLTVQLQSAEDWLQQHHALHTMAQDWPRWDEVLKHATKLHGQLQAAAHQVQAGIPVLAKHNQALAQATQRCHKAETALHSAHTVLQQATQALQEYDVEALAQRRQRLQHAQQQLLEAERLWVQLQSERTRQQELERNYVEAQATLSALATNVQELRSALPSARGRLEQAETALKTAQVACAENVIHLRAQLQADAPCPVCGSTAHPYTSGAAPLPRLLASFQAQVQSCRQALEELRLQETSAATRQSLEQQRLHRLSAEREALQRQLASSAAAWNAHAFVAVVVDERDAWFNERRHAVQQDVAELERAENAQRHAAKEREQAQKQRDIAQQQQVQAQSALHTAHTACQQAQQNIEAAQQRQSACQQQLEERLAELDTLFIGYAWRPVWEADAAAFHAARHAKVQEWQQQRQRSEQYRQQLRSVEIEVNHCAALLAERRDQQRHAAERLQNVQRELQEQQQQRQALCAGRSVTAVEAALAQDIGQAQRQLAQQEQLTKDAQQAQTSATTTLQQAQQLLSECYMAQQQALAAQQHWLSAYNARLASTLDLAALRTLLAHDHAWIEGERQALQTLAATLQAAASVHHERQAQCHQHEQQRQSAASAEELQAQQSALQEQLAAWQQRLSEAHFHLRQDDERRMQAQNLQREIAEQEQVSALWRNLDDLIGSASGDKFSKYAQQFTLDVLLGYANRHLVDIARRYRLERIPDSLALLVIDQDMGDEPRSVHSLSGGESFLVSLALALALASLSAQRVRVESLFIDEGFGSLDAETLRSALDALDNLQAQGRKVGVISHVPEMTERIGVRIHVQPQCAGQSRVSVQGG